MKNQRILSMAGVVIALLLACSVMAQPPNPEKGYQWKLIPELSDEFEGVSLDVDKWSNADPKRWRGRAPGLFLAEAVTLGDGKMRITADELAKPVFKKGKKFTHQGGHVYSKHKVKPGSYIECRMKANKTFMSSTFWLNNYPDESTGCQSRTTELDVQECIGFPASHPKTQQMGSNTHSRGIPEECSAIPAGSVGAKCETLGKVYDHYFTYGVWWKSPTEVLFYLNGEYKYSITPKSHFDIDLNIKMVVETYNWSPVPEDGGMTGTWEERTTFYDWVRTYEYVPVAEDVPLDKPYFKKLRSEQVPSSDLVEWQQVGPGMAGYCEEFWCHPTDPKVIMMSPDMFNTYGSWDAGKSWHTVKEADGTGKDMARIRKFEFSRQNPAFGLSITGAGGRIYKTTDMGRSWKEVASLGGRHAELTVDPNNDRIWYLGPGEFWNVKANQRHAKGQSRVFENHGIWKSTDGGDTWAKIKIGEYKDLDVGRIIVDPTDGHVLIMATNKGVLRSTDQGQTWEASDSGLEVNRPRDIDCYFDEKTKEYILYLIDQTAFADAEKTVSVQGGVYKSKDHGKSWEKITGNLAVDLNQITGKVLRGKYWKSLAHWFQTDIKTIQKRYPALPTATYDVFHRIQVNPNNKDEIYLSHNNKHDRSFLPGGTWKTSDGGKTWIATARDGRYWIEGADKQYWQSRNNPTNMNTTFSHLQPDMDRREDSWGNRFLEISQDGTVYICLDQQVLQSKDGGESWVQIDDNETAPGSKHWVGRGGSNLPGRYMLLETGIKDRYLLGSGEHGLWQTVPLGDYPDTKAVAVEQIEGQLNHRGAHSVGPIAVHPDNPDIIYFLIYRQNHRGKLRRSTDGGKTWENLSTIFAAETPMHERLVFQNSLLIDPITPDNMYFCATKKPITQVGGPYAKTLSKGDYGFHRSFDGGYTWELSNHGFPEGSSVRRVVLHPENPETLLAAVNSANGGLYQSTNQGGNWNKVKIPSAIQHVNNIFIDRNTKYFFISCGNSTATDQGGGVWRSKDEGKTWQKIFDLPYIWQCETSPINPNILTVSAALSNRAKGNATLNPGVYISFDGGNT
ncbi:MAG: hypothetical protein HRU41_33135 [Saprospiraceae bacterium]|nr:hypothetical protein [Saprospiraceae bacterium]